MFLRVTALVLGLITTFAIGVGGTAFTYESRIASLKEEHERRIARILEERRLYSELASRSVEMSERAFSFAASYHETLDLCMTRLQPPGMAEIAARHPPIKGGIGGPDTIRESNRLP